MLVPLFLQDPREPALTRNHEPVTVGIPLPRGMAAATDAWRLLVGDGRVLPFQARILDRWNDGSIRWALLDFQGPATASPEEALTLHLSGRRPAPPTGETIAVRQAADGIVIDTGGATFVLSGSTPLFFSSIRAAGRPLIEPAASSLRVVAANGQRCEVRWGAPAVEDHGPLRSSVRIDGTVRGPRVRLDLVARLHFYAASRVVRLLLTVRNPRAAAHPGGFWELGDPGSVLLKEVAVVLASSWSSPAQRVFWSVAPGEPVRAAERRVEVYQESSGGENWKSRNHVNRNGAVPNRFRGYWADIDGDVTGGLRATPIVMIEGGGGTVGAMFPAFWQNCPRAIEAVPDSITLGLFPRQSADVHELQGGEQKTHEMYLLFGNDPVTETPLDWCRDRLVGHASPEWYACTEAIPYLAPKAGRPGARWVPRSVEAQAEENYERLVDAAIEGDDTFDVKRERIDEYGWRHFGEIYGDHEAVFPITPQDGPLVSHYNNQYDAIAGLACQFMRSGDLRWHRHAADLTAHVIDIDIYHTDEDKSAYNHGLFWHTVHYVDAGKATHRSYPRTQGSHGGGPSSEHNYTTGLMLQYFLTGDPAARESAEGLARFVIEMDDGSKTVFRWLHRGHTGLCSASGSPLYHGPGRGSGNSLNALVDGHHLTGDRRFLEKAEQLIQRAVHPHQDIGALNLGDVERKWFYTMFLQALGKYLDYKIDLGEPDAMYAYARATLLHYARWMAQHEYPYLEKPEILAYPTETWAAQDVRKSEVFRYAMKHASGAERERFRERARFFFACSTATLEGMQTRTLARPVVLLLSHGWMNAHSEANPDEMAPPPEQEPAAFPAHLPFVPQKVMALRRARMLAVIAALGAVGLAAAGVLIFWR